MPFSSSSLHELQLKRLKMDDEEASGEYGDIILSNEEVHAETIASSSSKSMPTIVSNAGQEKAVVPSISQSKLFSQFVGMGFCHDMVLQVIQECGEEDEELVLEALLTYSALQKSSECIDFSADSNSLMIDEENFDDDISDVESRQENEEKVHFLSEEEQKFMILIEMGFDAEEVASAMNNCNNAALVEIQDFIYAAQMDETGSDLVGVTHASSDRNEAPSCSIFEREEEESMNCLSEEDKKFMVLVGMGFAAEEVASAMDKCNNAALDEIQDFIYASRMDKAAGSDLIGVTHATYDRNKAFHCCSIEHEEKASPSNLHKEFPNDSSMCKCSEEEEATTNNLWSNRTRQREKLELHDVRNNKLKGTLIYGEQPSKVPKKMIGFGVPDFPNVQTFRSIPKDAAGPPYFYFENVAFAPQGVWETMSRFLYEIQPEFVDSIHFSAAARKRGYIHNLPIDNRSPLEPRPPMTIQEALPHTKKWWPSWDPRTQLNCILGTPGSVSVANRIRIVLSGSSYPPTLRNQKYVVDECKKSNLIWVGPHTVAPLEPDEMEILLGYPKYHTRGAGNMAERYKSLGNSFQVDTVAYHFSVLKNMFPNGIRVLSLFSGIGGAEVALHRLGICLKVVVAVEISKVNKSIFRCWWKETQIGELIEMDDVRELDAKKLKDLVDTLGGFDLVVGGSPCNNISGVNRHSRNGLEGEKSSLFYEYYRILDKVKDIMASDSGKGLSLK